MVELNPGRFNILRNSFVSSIVYGLWGIAVVELVRLGESPPVIGLIVFGAAATCSIVIEPKQRTIPESHHAWNKIRSWFPFSGILIGTLYFVANLIFILSLSNVDITKIYPFVPASALVFMSLSIIETKARPSRGVIGAIVLSTIGLTISQLSEQGRILTVEPIWVVGGILMMLLYGFASFLTMKAAGKKDELVALPTVSTEFLLFAILFGVYSLYSASNPQAVKLDSVAIAVVAGILVAIGFILEIQSFAKAKGTRLTRFVNINLVNIVAGSDILLVLIASIFILDSYTIFGLVGMVFVFTGVFLLYRGQK